VDGAGHRGYRVAAGVGVLSGIGAEVAALPA
jgi:hypothetical protein